MHEYTGALFYLQEKGCPVSVRLCCFQNHFRGHVAVAGSSQYGAENLR